MGGDPGDGGTGRDLIKPQHIGQIGLADQHQIGAVKHRRILERLVLSFGGGHQHHPQALAQVVGGGADQIAHILDPEQIQIRQRQALRLQTIQGPAHLASLQMAALAGVDLQRRQAGGTQAAGVVVSGQIAHQHGLMQRPTAALRQTPDTSDGRLAQEGSLRSPFHVQRLRGSGSGGACIAMLSGPMRAAGIAMRTGPIPGASRRAIATCGTGIRST